VIVESFVVNLFSSPRIESICFFFRGTKFGFSLTPPFPRPAQAGLVKMVHLAGASHDIRRTRFDGYMRVLKEFLEEMYPQAG